MRVGIGFVVLAGCRFGFGEGDDTRSDATVVDAIASGDAREDGASTLNCPQTYMTVGSLTSKYRALMNSMDWPVSEQLCEADGTHLVVVDDAAELAAMPGLVPGQNLWIGTTDRVFLGTFRHVTGPTATYLPWDTTEPTATALECVYIASATIKILDQGCGSGRRAVCECDGIAVDPTSY